MRTATELPDISGVVSRGGLIDLGVSERRLRTAVQRTEILRLSEGHYISGDEWDSLDPWGRLRARTLAFAGAASPSSIVCGWSALALHRVPDVATPAPTPSLIRRKWGTSGSDRTTYGYVRNCVPPDEAITQVEGILVLEKGFAMADLVRSTGRLTSLIVADAIATDPAAAEGMAQSLTTLRKWPRFPRSEWLVRTTDPLSESPLESAGRFRALQAGLPIPISNAWLGPGYPERRVDLWWERFALAAEADGAVKYLVDPARAVALQHARQGSLEELGIRFVRYDWRGAFRHPAELAARFSAALDAARPPLSRALRWWPCQEGWAIRRGDVSVEECPGRTVPPASDRIVFR
ncbi:MAG: hypothetical protein WKF57_04485 [Nakamurella sp.]